MEILKQCYTSKQTVAGITSGLSRNKKQTNKALTKENEMKLSGEMDINFATVAIKVLSAVISACNERWHRPLVSQKCYRRWTFRSLLFSLLGWSSATIAAKASFACILFIPLLTYFLLPLAVLQMLGHCRIKSNLCCSPAQCTAAPVLYLLLHQSCISLWTECRLPTPKWV